jgi:hypothetical protein
VCVCLCVCVCVCVSIDQLGQPDLPRGNLTVVVLKSRLQMHGMEAQGLLLLRRFCENPRPRHTS